jgi:hypothetical protein
MQKETVQKLADRHDIEARYAPGYGDHAFRLTMSDGSKSLSDVFVIETESDLNRAANSLVQRLLSP